MLTHFSRLLNLQFIFGLSCKCQVWSRYSDWDTDQGEKEREMSIAGWENCNSYIPISWLRDKYEQTWSNAWDVFALTVCRCYLERKGLITFFSVPLSMPDLKQLYAHYIFNQSKPSSLNQQSKSCSILLTTFSLIALLLPFYHVSVTRYGWQQLECW